MQLRFRAGLLTESVTIENGLACQKPHRSGNFLTPMSQLGPDLGPKYEKEALGSDLDLRVA